MAALDAGCASAGCANAGCARSCKSLPPIEYFQQLVMLPGASDDT